MSSIRQKRKKTDYTRYNRVKLEQGGAAYFTRLKQLIDEARASLHLQVYIFAADGTGREVADRLVAAATRGVAVYVMADGYASQHLPSSFVHRLRAAGVHFRFFEPLFRSRHYYFGRRMHHKVAVADGMYALVGGINISDSYNDLPGKPAWLDFALYVEGEAAAGLCELCWQTWRGFSDGSNLLPCSAGRRPLTIADEEACSVAIRRNDWVRGKIQVSRCYLEMFRQARSEIVIISSYFLPGRLFRKHMYAAARRSIKVTVVLAGSSDVAIAKQAERFMYRSLLRRGIHIYEYRRAVLHAKMAVCDDSRCTLG
ncbi:MAG: phospholipase, partial [Bacteroidetes bacterium]|nr:phospholipase [Bacteroidota bacterium]